VSKKITHGCQDTFCYRLAASHEFLRLERGKAIARYVPSFVNGRSSRGDNRPYTL
jgi:hypothetical protein